MEKSISSALSQEAVAPEIATESKRSRFEDYEVTIGGNPCFAFGPALEILDGIGDCIRIDIPLKTIATVMAVASAAAGTPSPFEQSALLPDLPPAA